MKTRWTWPCKVTAIVTLDLPDEGVITSMNKMRPYPGMLWQMFAELLRVSMTPFSFPVSQFPFILKSLFFFRDTDTGYPITEAEKIHLDEQKRIGQENALKMLKDSIRVEKKE